MSKKLYVGNLSFDVTGDELEQLFKPFGTLQSAQLIKDRETGISKGFAFVEMSTGNEAQAAISGLNGKDVKGRSLTVNEARPQPEGNRGGGSRNSGGRRGSGGYGHGGGFGGRRH
jgi:RNA recognition motif-containing protein